jgi:hypothetical protein
MGKPQTGPGPLPRMLNQLGPDRIAQQIAEDREEMAVLLNRKTFEPSLPHMPMTVVMAMIATHMTGHPPLHEGAERGVAGQLEHEMEMIGHQTDREQCDRMFGFGCGEQVEEGRVVAGLVENRRTPVPPIQHMVDMTRDVPTWNPRA